MSDWRARATVLVVDDDEAVTTLFGKLLGKEGYTVQVAHDGQSALDAIASSLPDVVLLDVLIPGIDGFEVCRRLKRELATRLMPIILVTALNERDRRIEGLEAGADDFLTKPVDTQELLARVRSLAQLKRYTDDLDSAASIITTLAVMIEARDGQREGRCYRVANYAAALGRGLELGEHDLQTLYRGGYDAVTTQRPYQAAKPPDQAIEVLRQQVTRGWLGRDLVENFVAIIKSGRLATYIRATQL